MNRDYNLVQTFEIRALNYQGMQSAEKYVLYIS